MDQVLPIVSRNLSRMAWRIATLAMTLASSVVATGASSTAPTAAPNDAPIVKLLEKRLGGLIADLDISSDGTRLLVATRPDPDQPGGKTALTQLNSKGQVLWSRPVTWPIRAQSLSPDGRFVVVSTYDGKLAAIGPGGKTLWELEETCRPFVLKNHSVLCYHDEDFAPQIAFDYLDKNGKKKLSYPISGDILSFALSSDERNLALALTGGRVVFLELGTDQRTPVRALWQKKLPDELIEIVITSGPAPQILALLRQGKKVALQTIAADGTISPALPLDYAAEQLAVSSDGTNLVVRGSRPHFLAIYELQQKAPPKALDQTKGGIEGRAPGPNPEIIAGIAFGGACKDCLFLRDFKAKKSWELAVSPEATLFSLSRNKEPLVAVALDNGTLHIYRLLVKP